MCRERGVTLIELILTLVLISSACALAFPALRGVFFASSAAGTLTLLLREAQAVARANSVPVEVVVAADGHYTVRTLGPGEPICRRRGLLGVSVASNYPGGTLIFTEAGLPVLPGSASPRAGRFVLGRHSVVIQLGGCIRCR